MLPESFEEIASRDVADLLAEGTAESRRLDYKEKLPEGSDGAKKEFLADVCSFANSGGGDIVYGIRDRRSPSGQPTGLPDSIVGLASDNLSGECDRLEKLIRDGISPRIPGVQTKIVVIAEASVVVLRIANSWTKPHMVTIAGSSRFFSRNSTGKFALDVAEIGRAFAEQRSLGETLRSWRSERVFKSMEDDSPARLAGPGKLLFHLIPASAMVGQFGSAAWRMPVQVRNMIQPSSLSATYSRYNADGFLVCSKVENDSYLSYVQVFQNGCIEFGDGYILNAVFNSDARQERRIPSKTFEQKMIAMYNHGLDLLGALNVDGPIYVCCSLLSVQGMYMSRGDMDVSFGISHRIDRPVVLTPVVLVDSNHKQSAVLATVNSIWQANGYEQTPYLSGDTWNPYSGT